MPIESSQDHDHRPCVGTKYASPTTTAKARLRASLSLAFGGRKSGGSGGAKTLFGSDTGLGVGGTAETEAAHFEVLAAGYGLGTSSSSSSPNPARRSGCRPPVLFANQEGVDADAEEDEEDGNGNGMDGDHHEVRRGYEDFMHDIDIKHLHHHDRDEKDAVDEHVVGEEAVALADPFPPSPGDVLAAAAVQGIAGAGGSSGAYLDPIPEGGETTSPEPSSPGGGLVLERSCEDEDLLEQETKVNDKDNIAPKEKVEDESPALAGEHSNPDVNIENADETSSSGAATQDHKLQAQGRQVEGEVEQGVAEAEQEGGEAEEKSPKAGAEEPVEVDPIPIQAAESERESQEHFSRKGPEIEYRVKRVSARTSDNPEPDVASRRARQLEETLRVQKEKKRKEQEAAKQQQQEMEKKLTDLQQQVARISQINSSILDQQAKAQQENESLQATLDEKQVHIESLTATIEEKSVLIARKDLEAFSAGAGSTTREMWKEKQMKKAAEFLVTQPVAPAGGGSKTKAAAGELTWKGVGALVEEDFHDPMLQYSAYHDNFHAHDLHGEEHFDDPSLSRPPLFHSLEVLGSAAGAASTTSTVVDKIMDRHGGKEYMQQQIFTHASGLSTTGMETQNPVHDGEQREVVDDGTLEFTPLVQGELQVEVKREKLFRLRKEAATFFNDTESASLDARDDAEVVQRKVATAVEHVEHDLRTSQAILLELLNDELKEHHGQQNGPLSPEGVRLRAEASYALEKAKLENYLDSLRPKPLASGAASGDAAGAGATYQNRDKLFESEIDRKMGSFYGALREFDTATMGPASRVRPECMCLLPD
eukprot:g12264.t1